MGKVKKKQTETNAKVHDDNASKTENEPKDRNRKTSSLSSIWKPVLVTSLVLGIYIKTLHPSLPGGDSGELITAASEFGVAHPPGYPLFTVLAKCMLELFPFGTPAWRVNLLTAISSAIAAGLLAGVVKRLTDRDSAALLAVSVFCFSRLTWMWSVTAEVFGLNNLFVSLLMLIAVLFEQSQDNKKKLQRYALLGSFVCGLSLCNQHTSVLYIMCIVPWALTIMYGTQTLNLKLLIKLGMALLLGLLPYLYLPVSTFTHKARWTWGDQRTVKGFLTHLLRVEYGTFDLLKDHTGQGLLFGIRSYLEHIYTELTPVGYLLAIFSVLAIVKRFTTNQSRSTSVCVFYLMLVVYVVFFGWRANLDVSKPIMLGVVERFWIQSDLVVAVLAAVTFIDFIDMVNWLVDLHKWRIDLLFTAALAVFQIHRNFPLCDQSENYVIRDFALSLLNSFPQGAIILTKGDLPSNSLRYFSLCEGVRPDITLFDQEVMTYKWSVVLMGKFHPEIRFPGHFMQLHSGIVEDGMVSFTFRDLLDANIDKHPIFGCIGVQDHEPSWNVHYELWPFGMCSQFIKKGSTLNLSQWVNDTKQLGADWTYPNSGFPDTTWESVATGEMWGARTATAFFLLNKSDSYKPGPERTAMLMYSFQLYQEALKQYKFAPAYWHKNFAITCERLFYTEAKLDKKELLRSSIKHFKISIKKDPTDPSKEKIKTAVTALQEYLDNLPNS